MMAFYWRHNCELDFLAKHLASLFRRLASNYNSLWVAFELLFVADFFILSPFLRVLILVWFPSKVIISSRFCILIFLEISYFRCFASSLNA